MRSDFLAIALFLYNVRGEDDEHVYELRELMFLH